MNTFALAESNMPLIVTIHRTTGWFVVGILGILGVWGVTLAVMRREPGRRYWVGAGVGFAAGIAQVIMGLIGFAGEDKNPGNQHVFYGVVLMITFAFVYIYRVQFAKRPALSYGLLFLFAMGLGIRGIMTFGHSF